jgi:hypothetical protein
MNDLYALLWSRRQNCFHVEPLSRTCQSGMKFFRDNATNDYLLIGIGTHDEVGNRADELRHVCIERDEVRRLYEPGARP